MLTPIPPSSQAPWLDRREMEPGDRLLHDLIERPHPAEVEMAWERVDMPEHAHHRRLIRIYVGIRGIGPVLSWATDGWRNLYPRGNHGGNAASGGNWSSAARRVWHTIGEALSQRQADWDSLRPRRVSEVPRLPEALMEWAAQVS